MPLNMRLKLSALCLAALALAGCDLPMEPTAAPATNQSPMSALSAEMPRDARTMARSFVEVVERVTPVAEQECRARSPRINCDFQIFVDDRAGLPANAFQTVDARGRPIIVFTISLIADARNADELAFVLAHEAAHHIEGHLDRQRRNATMGAVVFGGLAGATGGDPQGAWRRRGCAQLFEGIRAGGRPAGGHHRLSRRL